MRTLGRQLDAASYEAFKAALDVQLPHVAAAVQTVNAAGRFAINGTVDANTLALISQIYADNQSAPIYDIAASQSRTRGRKQTWHARAKRQANGMRFHKG